jgi:hypothetical protein
VVLIDEVSSNVSGGKSRDAHAVFQADLFLQARNDDVQRSALVSVFLRVLEYHTGCRLTFSTLCV